MMKKNKLFTVILLVFLFYSVFALFHGLSQKAVLFIRQDTAPAYTQAIVNFDVKDWEN